MGTIEGSKKKMSSILNNPYASLNEIANWFKTSLGMPEDTYVRPDYMDVVNPEIRSLDDLSKLLGTNITYNKDEIINSYREATDAGYRANLVEQGNAEKGYYRSMAAAQDTALDTIRQQYAQGIANGASSGMQAANLLSASLGNSQKFSEEATVLAQDRQKLGADYATSLKNDVVNGTKYANDVASTFGTLSHSLYNDQIQQQAAQLSYNQGINTDYAGYQASKHSALANLLASYGASSAGIYNNNNSAVTAIEQAMQSRAGQEEAARIAAEAQVEAANIAARASAAYSSAGSSMSGAGTTYNGASSGGSGGSSKTYRVYSNGASGKALSGSFNSKAAAAAWAKTNVRVGGNNISIR